MNLEKIGLFLFLKHMRQFDDIRKHVLTAVREIVLALSSSVDLVGRAAQDQNLTQKAPILDNVLRKIDFVLDFALKFLPEIPQNASLDLGAVKLELFESVLTVIEEEQERLGIQKDERSGVQLEALEAIKNAFLSRMKVLNGGGGETHFETPQASKKAVHS